MAEVLAELQSLGAIDPAGQAQIVEDLKRTPVELWPEYLQTFKATLAYRKQYQERLVREQSARAATQLALQQYPITTASGQGSDLLQNVPTAYAEAETQPAQLAQFTTAADPAGNLLPQQSAIQVAPAATPRIEQAIPAPAPASEQQAASLANPPQPQTTLTQPAAQSQVPAASEGAVPPPQTPAPSLSGVMLASSSSPTVASTDAATFKGISPAALEKAESAATWQEELASAIKLLEAKTVEMPTTPAETSLHVSLRLLYLVAGRRDDALRPISGIAPAQQDFWSKQLYGLSVYLDDKRAEDRSLQAAETMTHLKGAMARLAESASLVVRNLHFCTEVSSYGVFKKFDKYEFAANQEVLLYAEIENFTSEATDRGYHTALKSSYQILDKTGTRVADQDFAVTEEHCQNLRRDFFVRYYLWTPKTISPGNYTLQLTIEDTKGQKIGQSAIEFTIKQQ